VTNGAPGVQASAALSQHPLAAAALGEAAGEVLEDLGTGADLVVVAAGGAHAASLGSIAEAVGNLLAPRQLLVIGAPGTLGAGTAAPDVASVMLWGATGLGAASVSPDVLTDDAAWHGLPAEGTLVVVAAGGAHLPRLVDSLAAQRPGLAVVGGMVDPPGRGGRVGGDGRSDDTIAGVVLPAGVATATSGGAVRPIGEAMVVTDANGPVVAALAGAPAADQLDATVATLGPDDRRALTGGLFLCRVVEERSLEPDAGDVVAHGVRGLVSGTRSLALDTTVEVGTLVRFGCLDPDVVDVELRRALADASVGAPAAGALLFSCVARGGGLLADDAHDVVVAAETLGTTAVGGAFCVGEVGPRGGRSWLSGYTAAALVVHAGAPSALG
jgi:small ligand-binding sensory domain FIST